MSCDDQLLVLVDGYNATEDSHNAEDGIMMDTFIPTVVLDKRYHQANYQFYMFFYFFYHWFSILL